MYFINKKMILLLKYNFFLILVYFMITFHKSLTIPLDKYEIKYNYSIFISFN